MTKASFVKMELVYAHGEVRPIVMSIDKDSYGYIWFMDQAQRDMLGIVEVRVG